ncbi:MAG: LemA family protein [Acidimicrobiia bacterium]|nr:LemA family protein [Acidimicrobiia bacterium]
MHVGYVIAAVVIVVLALVFFAIYNGLVRLRNRTDNAWAQVDVQLKRRYDLIPNLVEAVKGYASHEQSTFEQVVEARTQALAAGTIEEQTNAENLLTGALRQLFALAESYPDLKASQNFSELQAQLGETENKVTVSRQIYNDAVLTFNNRVQTVPSNLVAGLTGFVVKPFFEAPDEVDQAPEVRF